MPVTLEQITARLNVPELFQQNGARGGRQKGEQMEGATCPFCDDPDHFGYNSKAGLWKCRKCGESGNLVTLVSKVRKCPTGQAFKALMAEAGLTPEEVRPPKKRGRPPGTGRKAAPGGDDGKLPVSNVNAGRIYERFVELLPLTDAHRQKLQKKRGFTLTTIETFRLRSGGPHVAGILSQLADEFGESDLLDAALTITVNGRACFNDQLLEDRIIIPYLDERGAPYHIRPHKLGLERPLEPYARCLLKERPEHVILTEGEFKAIALRQWRIPAIGVPGVSSFGGKHFERSAD
ncbi:MAG: DNA primase, partial [Actinobacteria bacterium]|nr:DNA primase [Actinomycetota bacterium]